MGLAGLPSRSMTGDRTATDEHNRSWRRWWKDWGDPILGWLMMGSLAGMLIEHGGLGFDLGAVGVILYGVGTVGVFVLHRLGYVYAPCKR